MSLSATPLRTLIGDLAARTPTPGGGAAAAVAAALGCSAGAMAARYTTGLKWGALSDQALALAETLERAAGDCLRLADADVAAYAALTAARKEKDAAVVAHAQERSLAVPADLLAACALNAASLHGFLELSNPHLVSDVKVAIHLLAGAGRAAWQTLLVNQPDLDQQSAAGAQLRALDRAEAAALGVGGAGGTP